MEKQYLSLTTKAPTANVYGFGENIHRSFRHQFQKTETWAMLARDQPPGQDPNQVGVLFLTTVGRPAKTPNHKTSRHSTTILIGNLDQDTSIATDRDHIGWSVTALIYIAQTVVLNPVYKLLVKTFRSDANSCKFETSLFQCQTTCRQCVSILNLQTHGIDRYESILNTF